MTDGKPASHPRPIGPEELKAFTHPLRMAMYAALRDYGPATASQLARRLGESSGQTSYHLRQLERHGFVEDDPERPGGRERWWRPVAFSLDDPGVLRDPASALAARAMLDEVVADRARVLRRWIDSLETGEAPGSGWPADVAAVDATTVALTVVEAEALVAAVQETIEEHADRAKARRREGETAGRRRVRIYFDAIPLPAEPGD
jgi:DNA-binding transcriptional ArsR family regulator